MKGFLTIAQNGKEDYVRMAYALSMSLQVSQSKYKNLSIIVNEGDEIPARYLPLFDKIIYVEKISNDWKIQNKWQYFQLTPYDETIVLDTDMLFFNDISNIWKYLGKYYDIEFTTSVLNYRGDVIISDFYRKTFTENKLPNLYTAFFYFKKTSEVENYFKLVECIFKNWEEFYKRLLKNPPKHLSGDVAYALAAKVLYERAWNSPLRFIHMRGRLQDSTIVDDWNKYLQSFFTKYGDLVGLKINNYSQMYPFHYINKEFLNDEVIELYENTLHLF